jgi:hypothetical protein
MASFTFARRIDARNRIIASSWLLHAENDRVGESNSAASLIALPVSAAEIAMHPASHAAAANATVASKTFFEGELHQMGNACAASVRAMPGQSIDQPLPRAASPNTAAL